LEENFKVSPRSDGYDGQFFYYFARYPFADSEDYDHMDMPPYRYQRIGYPLLSALVGLGFPSALPLALLLVNLVAIVVSTLIVVKESGLEGVLSIGVRRRAEEKPVLVPPAMAEHKGVGHVEPRSPLVHRAVRQIDLVEGQQHGPIELRRLDLAHQLIHVAGLLLTFAFRFQEAVPPSDEGHRHGVHEPGPGVTPALLRPREEVHVAVYLHLPKANPITFEYTQIGNDASSKRLAELGLFLY
jgi:hypothetical protein